MLNSKGVYLKEGFTAIPEKVDIIPTKLITIHTNCNMGWYPQTFEQAERRFWDSMQNEWEAELQDLVEQKNQESRLLHKQVQTLHKQLQEEQANLKTVNDELTNEKLQCKHYKKMMKDNLLWVAKEVYWVFFWSNEMDFLQIC